jgi:hypothetical protein
MDIVLKEKGESMRYFTLIGLLSLSLLLSAQNPAGMSLIMDGDGDYMELSYYPDGLIFDSPATIEFWLKANIDHKIDSSSGAIWSINDGNEFGNGEFFLINWGHSTQYLTDERISVIHALQSQGMVTLYGLVDNGTYSGQWHHYAVICDGSAYTLYIDGQISSLTPASTFPNQTPGDYGESIIPQITATVGERILGATVDVELDGSIDELRIWNIARNSHQIQQTWNDTLSPIYYTSLDSGLVGYWRFDEMEDLGVNSDGADDIRDLSINGYHGDLAGDATIDTSKAPLEIENGLNEIPSKFHLSQNYPNPFNPTTTIGFDLPKSADVRLIVYDILGRKVATLLNKKITPGRYEVEWNAEEYPGGIYFYRLAASGHGSVKKMLLVK